MEKEFIKYEQALALKGLDFNEPCFGYYVDGELRGINLGIEQLGGIEPYYERFGFHTLSNHSIDNTNKMVVTAPTYSQSFRWFRDKHKLAVDIRSEHLGYYTSIVDREKILRITMKPVNIFETYEDAEFECLKKLIEILKQRNNENSVSV